MWFIFRCGIILLIAVASFTGDYTNDSFVEDSKFVFFCVGVCVAFSFIPILWGLFHLFFSKHLIFEFPSLKGSPFRKNAPLHSIWFGGVLAIASGLCSIARNVNAGISSDGLLILAVGIGSIAGCFLITKIFRKRFTNNSDIVRFKVNEVKK